MPDPAYTYMLDAAVVLPFKGFDRNGKPTVDHSAAFQIRVRWDDSQSEGTDAQGNSVTYDATVETSRNLTMFSRLWRGTLEEWVGTGSSFEPSLLHELKNVNVVRDLKNRAIGRTYKLMRYKDV